MKIYGVIAEYNPFHNGHKYQLNQSCADGAVVVVMSGNFVERSESAVLSKRYRTEMALQNGADLVIELPLCYATASAEKFAFGGVFLLNSLGCVDVLSFGSECGDVDLLKETASAVSSPKVDAFIKTELEKGISYPTARQNAVNSFFSADITNVLSQPNNILAVEYIKALNKTNNRIEPLTVKRTGAEHDSEVASGNIASAGAIRQLIKDNRDFSHFVPESVYNIILSAQEKKQFPSDFEKLTMAILISLRSKTAADFVNVPDVSEGIENRILSAAKSAKTLDELYSLAKTKRYTHSRIRRIVLCSFLGITREMSECPPQYIRVLGFNKQGREILKTARQTATLPVVMSTSDIKKLGDKALRQFSLECVSTDIFNMTLPEIMQSGTEMTDNIVKFE